MPSHQAPIRPALIEGVERTNVVMVRGPGQSIGVSSRRDPYTMEVDRKKNCYTYRGFEHMVHHCRNWRRKMVADGRRLEYRG